jgi:hypothetical protein
MTSVQDRSYAHQATDAGDTVRLRTRFYGTKLHRFRANYCTRMPTVGNRNKAFAREVDAERFSTTVEASKLAGTFTDRSWS